MIKITVCDSEYQLKDLSKDNIRSMSRQIGACFWYRISVELEGASISFGSDNSPSWGSAITRQLTHREKDIQECWKATHAIDHNNINGLFKFLEYIAKYE